MTRAMDQSGSTALAVGADDWTGDQLEMVRVFLDEVCPLKKAKGSNQLDCMNKSHTSNFHLLSDDTAVGQYEQASDSKVEVFTFHIFPQKLNTPVTFFFFSILV